MSLHYFSFVCTFVMKYNKRSFQFVYFGVKVTNESPSLPRHEQNVMNSRSEETLGS